MNHLSNCRRNIYFCRVKSFVCIHGHFYQPPRENAWLEVIERQESAFPYHNWNARISAECYGPNGASRILNEENKIIDIVNNYANISFNFGPTLLSWMEQYDKDAYEAVRMADKISQQRRSGHGNALAQVYNHIIMPLASARDRDTQIIWGIADFKKRFQREPEGMWLAETAVDTPTLELLAQHQIKFTILAPRQAKAFKKIGDEQWLPVNENQLDTSVPYLCKLPSGNSIVLFFYNGVISREVAFNGLLNSGKLFSERLIAAAKDTDAPQLINIATDGESYGHHHYRGDMALASCMDYLAKNKNVQVTNYGEYLSKFPVQHEIQIHENSSWSCVHGVERWRSNCGCTDGGNPGFHQRWRAPLRAALNWLKDKADQVFEAELRTLTSSPWDLRNDYISIVLDRSEENITRFFAKNFKSSVSEIQKIKMVRLLEMQRHSMLMFTSCGWFFDEVSRIETKQILQYADRVIQIAEHESSSKLYQEFLLLLEQAPSNITQYETARGLYEKEIRPQRLTLTKVGVHHAVLSLFEDVPEECAVFNYTIKNDFSEKMMAGEQVLAVGNMYINSTFTYASQEFQYAALYLGQHHVIGGFAETLDGEQVEELYLKLRDAFRKSNLNEVILLIRTVFGDKSFSFDDLFGDAKEQLLNRILQKDISIAEDNYREVYEKTFTLVNMLQQQKKKIPELLLRNTAAVINADLKKVFSETKPNILKLEQLVDEALKWKVELDAENIAFVVSARLYDLVEYLSFKVDDMQHLDNLSRILIKLNELKLKFRLWKIQNKYYRIGKDFIGNEQFMKTLGEQEYKTWLLKFKAIGEQLNIRF